MADLTRTSLQGLVRTFKDMGDGTHAEVVSTVPDVNEDVTVFASAARTATPTPYDGTNLTGRGLHLVIDCTVDPALASVVFTLQGKDVASGKFYTILASAAITGVGTTVLKVFPGSAVAANATANDILPRNWRVIATHADTDSITYSVGASLIG